MNRIRIGLFLTLMWGVIYASTGLFTNLRDVGVGAAIAGAAALLLGLIDYLETRHDEQLYHERIAVWARRDDGG